jgi:DNA-directed RNA polymerase subunit L
MELNFIEDKKNKIVVEIRGEGHTFCNLLKAKLNEKGAKTAAYRIEHPLIGVPKLMVETSSGSARDAVKKACDAIKKEAGKFKKDASGLK